MRRCDPLADSEAAMDVSYSLTLLSQELTSNREDPCMGAKVTLLIPSVGGLESSNSIFRGILEVY